MPAKTETTQEAVHDDLRPGGVLVAVDGSESSLEALAWAAQEASQREVLLTIAHAYHWPATGLAAMEAVGFLMDALARDSSDILEAATAAARTRFPDLQVQTVSQLGSPVPALVGLSEGRELLVVGSRGLGGFAGMVLGSVSTGVIAHALCPVAVIRGDQEINPKAPVVAGVDASAAQSDQVLREAFGAAARRGCSLLVVNVWQNPAAAVGADDHRKVEQWEAWRQGVQDELTGRVERVRGEFTEVPVDIRVQPGRTSQVLLEKAQGAQLIVVGTRGHGEFKGMLLGSTSRALVQHADCPVLVVR